MCKTRSPFWGEIRLKTQELSWVSGYPGYPDNPYFTTVWKPFLQTLPAPHFEVILEPQGSGWANSRLLLLFVYACMCVFACVCPDIAVTRTWAIIMVFRGYLEFSHFRSFLEKWSMWCVSIGFNSSIERPRGGQVEGKLPSRCILSTPVNRIWR